MAGEYGSSATYVIESWPKHFAAQAPVVSDFRLFRRRGRCRRCVQPGGACLAGARCFSLAFCHYLRPGCENIPEAEDWKEKHAGSAGTYGRHSHRGEHRIINILMTFARCRCAVVLFPCR